MIRFLAVILAVLVLASPRPSIAESHPQAAPPAGISADQARAALEVLNDPAKRAAFAATLNAIVKANPAASHTPASAAAPPAATPAQPAPAETTINGVSIPLAPDSLGAQILLSASLFLDRAGNEAWRAAEAVQSLPLLYGWAVVMATNPIARDMLVDVTWRVVVVMALVIAFGFWVRRAMHRPIARLEARAPAAHPRETPIREEPPPEEGVARAEAGETESPLSTGPHTSAWTLLKLVPLVLARLLLELVPVLGIVIIGHALIASPLGGQTVSRLVILAVLEAYAICIALLSVAHMLLSPDASRLRLFDVPDAAAGYMMRWSRRLILIAVIGYAIGEVGMLLGLSDVSHEAFQKTVGLALHVCLAIIVIQKRRQVRRWLRAPAGSTGVLVTVRDQLARVWHWIALFLLVAGWLIWAVEMPHGYTAVLRYLVLTAAILIGARLTLLLLLGIVDRGMRPPGEIVGLYPTIQVRLQHYHPVVAMVLRVTVYLLCALGLMQLYGTNAFLWLIRSNLGQHILSASMTLLVTVIAAFAVWEAANLAMQSHLDRLQRDAQMAKSARLRTLLPLLRTTLWITIAVVAGLMILSQIGIDIAPLLAGAGIVGVAIGFGSQKLVQDLITGIFLLLENAMQVGDWVTVSGLSGSVEALSVRTIRLRAGDGSVHIIPFSAVTSVTNVNRGQGNAPVTIVVPFEEDTDHISDVLKEIVAGMRQDPDFSTRILGDLQLWGVDKVDGASVTIAGQIVCTDSGRWPVQREFNRRMKRRFQELGIGIYNPAQTMTLSVQLPSEKGKDDEHTDAGH